MIRLDNRNDLCLEDVVRQLRDVAVHVLPRMYRPEKHLFAFRLRRSPEGDILEAVSQRYTAIVLIGLATEDERTAAAVLTGHDPRDICGRLIDDIGRTDDLGEVALTLWAARALGHPGAAAALERLRSMEPATGHFPTVEVSWCLTALSVPGSDVTDGALAEAVAKRLLASFNKESALFPHWPAGARPATLRAHVACFADLVYPIQAFSRYHQVSHSIEAIDAARRCADRMCHLQGPQGQWWWHFDVRTGQVIEGYPVYAVHQEAMAPMALFALQEACGADHTDAVVKGLQWLADPPEIPDSLIDAEAGIIWRKVARHEPFKATRSVQALASRLHPSLRIPGLNRMFRPTFVDYESRPYEMGWVLHAWPGGRVLTQTGTGAPRKLAAGPCGRTPRKHDVDGNAAAGRAPSGK